MTAPSERDLDGCLERGLTTLFKHLRPDDDERSTVPPARLEDEPVPERLGRYRVVDRLGRGGTGTVYRVEDGQLGRDLAVKVLSRRFAGDPDLIERFLREARVCSRLQHPGIVPIHEVGRLDDGRPYFTMKIVAGETLEALLTGRRDPVDRRRRFLEVFEKVCQTVAFAHSRGVVHCDLKPGNVMVGAFGEVQVVDWGFAGASGELRDENSPRVAGTPAYMAPEQTRANGGALDPRADVFGLGAVLCEILTGAPPYLGESGLEVMLRATRGWLDEAHQRLRTCGGDPVLVALAQRCLSVDPVARPADAGVVARQVAEHLAAVEQRAHELEVEAARAQARSASERRVMRLTVGWVLTCAAFLVVGALGYTWLDGRHRARTERTERAILAEIQRAAALRDHARSLGPADATAWANADAAARQAASVAAALALESPLRGRAERLAAEVVDERASVQRDARMLAWLADVRPHLSLDHPAEVVDRAYAQAFADWGVLVDRGASDAGIERIENSAIRTQASAALLDWAAVRRRRGADWFQLLDLADRADDDPVRTRLRAAVRSADLGQLHAVAGALELGSSTPATCSLLASSLHAAGDPDAAIEVARRAYRQWPEDAELSHNLAVWLTQLDDPPRDEIVRVLSSCVAVRPDSAHALTDLGLALTYAGEHDAALAFLNRAVELDPGYARALTNAGFAALEAGRPAAAESYYRQSIAIAPASLSSRCGLGRTLEQDERYEAALAEYERALQIDPANTYAWFRIGQVRRRLGDFDGAIAAYRETLRIDPEHAHALCNLGLVLRSKAQYPQAVAAMRRGHEIGSAGRDWDHPSARWLAELEAVAAAAPRLTAIADGAVAATGAPELAEAARHAHRLGRYAAAVALWRQVAAADEGVLTAGRGGWYDPACAAVRAAAGEGDAAGLGADERDAFRRQALAWLRKDLELRAARAKSDDAERLLAHWLHDRDLSTVRDPAAIAALPRDVATGFEELWNDHAALLGRLR